MIVEITPTTKSKSKGKSKGVLTNTNLFVTVNLSVATTSKIPVINTNIMNFGISKASVVRLVNTNRVDKIKTVNPALNINPK